MPVSPAQEPEIPTTPEWRERMRSVRRAKKISQGRLGAAVGVSQAQISDIETGASKASTAVLAICRELDIEPPLVTDNELQRRWVEAGRVLAAKYPAVFRTQLAYVQDLIKGLSSDESQSGDS